MLGRVLEGRQACRRGGGRHGGLGHAGEGAGRVYVKQGVSLGCKGGRSARRWQGKVDQLASAGVSAAASRQRKVGRE